MCVCLSAAVTEMIALRPPSYHTIEDPPPYPDDDVDDRPLMAVGDKRPAHSSVALTNRADIEHLLANSSELLQLCDHEDAVDQPVTRPTAVDIAVRRQFRDAVGSRRRLEPPTCGPSVYNSHDEQITDPLTPWTQGRTRWTDGPADTEQFWRHEHRHQLVFDLPPAGTGGSRSSPRRSTVQANIVSPRHADRSAGVPYSVTCPSCFDGCLLDAARHVQPLVRQVPRPSASGEPVVSAAARSPCDRACETRQTSSVFEISSYIIASRASSASVQPSDAV